MSTTPAIDAAWLAKAKRECDDHYLSTTKVLLLIEEVERLMEQLAAAEKRASEAVEHLQHMAYCQSCGESDWDNCEEGTKAKAFLEAALAAGGQE